LVRGSPKLVSFLTPRRAFMPSRSLPDDQDYAPIAGLFELREAVASLYNRFYRQGLPSQYSAENVCISGGGRTALTRAAASLGSINLGHFLPDYTAYEELLDIFRAFTSIPILLDADSGYSFTADDLRREILGRGLSVILASNPCNPTGKVVAGEELDRWVAVARQLDCTLLLDEFYSHYIYRGRAGALPLQSAARYVEDVDRDPIVIFDGLTKNWRYPGWRITWAVGPQSVIERFASAGSFLDGGGSKPLQRAAIPLLDDDYVRKEALATLHVFRDKRDLAVSRLERLRRSRERDRCKEAVTENRVSFGLSPPQRRGRGWNSVDSDCANADTRAPMKMWSRSPSTHCSDGSSLACSGSPPSRTTSSTAARSAGNPSGRHETRRCSPEGRELPDPARSARRRC
jgi:aspartate/methionine/tyrosine aminotransferase